LILIVFLGTYATEITGFGVPRQKNSFPEYIDKVIDWSMFNTPTWDATYLLENLLDQFTAGLSQPDTPLFYAKSDQLDSQDPIVYWRLGSLEKYEYFDKAPYTTNWDNTDDMKRTLTPTQSSAPYSQQIPENERTAQFTIRLPLNYSDSIADVTIFPYFDNYLPTTWNGGTGIPPSPAGSYLDSSSFRLYDDSSGFLSFPLTNGNPLSASTLETREVFPMASTNDLLGIEANIQGLAETSDNNGVLEYTMDYKAPDIQSSAIFSLLGTDQDYIDCTGSADWNSIKNLYLQLPNDTGQLPDNYYVDNGLIANVRNFYEDWAPTIAFHADNFSTGFDGQSVFMKAYSVMQEFAPDGSLELEFDQEMWLREETGIAVDHPEEYEDYNEWFIDEKKGVSLHFASAYTTIMRMMGYPSRVVVGYLAGNDSVDYFPYRMVSSRFLHAWSEVLVPMDIFGVRHVEWVSFDPLLAYFANLYGIDLPADIIPTSTEAQALMIDPTYDLETNGLAQAILDNDPSDFNNWIIQRSVVDQRALGEGPATIIHGQTINIAVRLISAPSIASWLPTEGENVTFYIGTVGENESGTWVGEDKTNSSGIAELQLTIDLTIHGIRTVQFYAVVEDWVIDFSIEKAALSWIYILGF
jgi:hypothetical protein